MVDLYLRGDLFKALPTTPAPKKKSTRKKPFFVSVGDKNSKNIKYIFYGGNSHGGGIFGHVRNEWDARGKKDGVKYVFARYDRPQGRGGELNRQVRRYNSVINLLKKRHGGKIPVAAAYHVGFNLIGKNASDNFRNILTSHKGYTPNVMVLSSPQPYRKWRNATKRNLRTKWRNAGGKIIQDIGGITYHNSGDLSYIPTRRIVRKRNGRTVVTNDTVHLDKKGYGKLYSQTLGKGKAPTTTSPTPSPTIPSQYSRAKHYKQGYAKRPGNWKKRALNIHRRYGDLIAASANEIGKTPRERRVLQVYMAGLIAAETRGARSDARKYNVGRRTTPIERLTIHTDEYKQGKIPKRPEEEALWKRIKKEEPNSYKRIVKFRKAGGETYFKKDIFKQPLRAYGLTQLLPGTALRNRPKNMSRKEFIKKWKAGAWKDPRFTIPISMRYAAKEMRDIISRYEKNHGKGSLKDEDLRNILHIAYHGGHRTGNTLLWKLKETKIPFSKKPLVSHLGRSSAYAGYNSKAIHAAQYYKELMEPPVSRRKAEAESARLGPRPVRSNIEFMGQVEARRRREAQSPKPILVRPKGPVEEKPPQPHSKPSSDKPPQSSHVAPSLRVEEYKPVKAKVAEAHQPPPRHRAIEHRRHVVASTPPVQHQAPPVQHQAPPVQHKAPPVQHKAPPVAAAKNEHKASIPTKGESLVVSLSGAFGSDLNEVLYIDDFNLSKSLDMANKYKEIN